MKKEEKGSTNYDNSFGVASVVLGILSVIFASILGILIGIIALVFSVRQAKINPNSWSKWGKILSIIGIVLSILTVVLLLTGLFANPGLIQGI
jgi:hypothetical protein